MNKNSILTMLVFIILVNACSNLGTKQNCEKTEHKIVNNHRFQLLWSKSNVYALQSAFNPMIQGVASTFFIGVQDSSYDSSVVAFETKTGNMLWQHTINLPTSMLANGTSLYVGDYNKIEVYDLRTGYWEKEISIPNVGVVQNIYSNEQNLYIRTGNGSWVVYDMNDEAVELSGPLLSYTPFLIENEILYLHDIEGIKALDTRTQTVIWKYKIAESINVHPTFTKDTVIVSSSSGNIYNVDKKTGNLIWRLDADTISNVAVDTSRLYFLTKDGYLRVFDVISGQEIEKLEFSPASFQLSTSDKLVGGYNVWVDSQNEIVILSLGDSCQLMALKTEMPR